MSNLAVDALVEKWKEVVAEREKMYNDYSAQIDELETAIKLITGENPKDMPLRERYDDEHPNYIRNTEDGI